MAKKNSTPAPLVMNTPAPHTTSGPTTSELKERFKARSIPLETDFADLIDMAECGQRAVGHAYGQTLDPTSGLVLNEQEQLKVLVNPNGGIIVDEAGIGINTSPVNGLTIANNNLMVAVSTVNPGLILKDDGIGLEDLLHIKLLGKIHSAQFYAMNGRMILVISQGSGTNPTFVYVYGRNGNCVKYNAEDLPKLNGVDATTIVYKTASVIGFHNVVDMMVFSDEVAEGDIISNIFAGSGGAIYDTVTVMLI